MNRQNSLAALFADGLKLLCSIFVVDAQTYRPERYYMRGPGPKWRQKHTPLA